MRSSTRTICFDIEVAFYPEITKMAMDKGVDEKKFSWHIDAAMRYVTHISYKINDETVVDLSLLDHKGSLVGDANEKLLLESFAKVYNTCHESVAHYGSKFDIRFLNARMTRLGLPPLRPIKLRDTWRILKDHFALPNNKLDTAIRFFNCPYGKPSLDWDIWRRVSLGDVKAHKILRHRCRYDVLSLAWIYKNKLRAFDAGTVNRALAHDKVFIDDAAVSDQLRIMKCRTCEKRGTYKREGYSYTTTCVNAQLSCRECFRWATAPIKKNGTLGRIR